VNPEILTSITAAKGIEFDGRGATARELREQSNWWRPGTGKLNGKVRWNLPRGDRCLRAAEWSLAEAAMACHQLDERYFFALRFQFALDDSVYYALRRHLLTYARGQARRHDWPTTVPTFKGQRRYLTPLVDMQLLEIRQPWRFIRKDSKAPGMCRLILNVNEITWRRQVAPLYEVIAEEYRRWIGVGVRHMRLWMRDG
jgi:hypothetical protein